MEDSENGEVSKLLQQASVIGIFSRVEVSSGLRRFVLVVYN